MKTSKTIFSIFCAAVSVLCIGCNPKEEIDLISFSIDKTSVTFTEEGQKTTITVTPLPNNAKVNFSWQSNNATVATVSKTGNLTAEITAVANGETTIKVASGSVEKTISVKVTIGSTQPADGDGTEANPYNVASTLALFDATGALPTAVWVNGYIVGGIIYDPATPNGTDYKTTKIDGPEDVIFSADVRNTSVLIADSKTETDYTKCVAVELPSGDLRNIINLRSNAGNLHKMLAIKGNLSRYFAVPGVRSTTDFKLEGYVPPTVPTTPNYTTKFLDETLQTQASFDKFTAISITGAEVWNFNPANASYGAQISGFSSNASHANEDWLISPVINLTGQSNVLMSFDHARGPASSITVGVTEGWYKVFATADFTGNITTTTWVEVTGVYHGTGAWGFVTSGSLNIPASAISANTRIALKYVCSDAASATWEVKNLVVGK